MREYVRNDALYTHIYVCTAHVIALLPREASSFMGIQPIDRSVGSPGRCLSAKFPSRINPFRSPSPPALCKPLRVSSEKFPCIHITRVHLISTDLSTLCPIVSHDGDYEGMKGAWWLDRVFGDRPLSAGANFHFAWPTGLYVAHRLPLSTLLFMLSCSLGKSHKKLRSETKI